VSVKPSKGSAKLAAIGKDVRRKLGKAPAAQVISGGGFDLHVVQNFLSRAECAGLIALIDADAVPSSLYAGTEIDGFRTSFSCNLDPFEPLVASIEARISALTGIDPRHGEALQGQRYGPGQQFKPHHDYFHTSEAYWEPERLNGGQRSWTGMIYLNQPDGGGETNFPKAGLCLSPQPGMLVLWNNMKNDGSPQDNSIHEGCAVLGGTKYIVTKWFRERFWARSAVDHGPAQKKQRS
jgi:prolyl 4-hydroxylase